MQHGLWKLCGTSVDSDSDKPLLANCYSPLILFIDSLNSPSSPSAAFNVSVSPTPLISCNCFYGFIFTHGCVQHGTL